MADERMTSASLYVALPTPFDDRGRVDEKAVDHLVDYLVAREITGLALLTEAGEDPVLTPDERRLLVERVLGRPLQGKGVLVAVSAIGTREAVDLARLGEQKGAKGILIAPLSAPGLGYRELYRHVDRLARSVQIPSYLVHRPGNAAAQLQPEELSTLAKHEALKGVYLPQGTPAQVKPWAKRLKGKGVEIFTGCALSLGPAARAGATGAICGLSMIGIDAAIGVVNAVRKSDVDALKKLEKEVRPAVELLGPPIPDEEQTGVQRLASKIAQQSLSATQASSVPFSMIKEALKAQGHPVPAFVRPPYEAVPAADVERMKHVLKTSRLMS